MSQRPLEYLNEMGITSWELLHPQRLEQYQVPRIDLDSKARLLLVSPVCPEGALAAMFEKVLKTLPLALEQACHMTPEQLPQLGEHQLEWLWFAGCEQPDIDFSEVKVLHSPLLSNIDGNNQERRALWQQICAMQ